MAGTGREMIRIVVADDHWVVRVGLRRVLTSDYAFDVVGEAIDGEDAVRLARTLEPDVVLMDLLMPGMDGVAAIAAIRREVPGVAVVALTSALEDHLVVGALRAGAIGYLLKTSGAEELKQAVRAAAAGQVHLSPLAAARLVREMPTPERRLTERETDVLRLLGQGLANKEIARTLQIGPGTVKSHVSSILTKLRVHGRTQAALAARELGLL
jgi:DNA-binding NarL/FixJ family response regulator